ncbi:hypothetical protein BJI69_04740 [Luteibacter rhizovicinus DSM 16549]|uniref:Uncharacterized protein n=1 Tax=Luteibacter rhizovicinus DSM 16549 TaxID=1440763 RepID=A0A0G9HDK8_9GAMM|nr:DNA-binding domain-containing protein [Luteibacter rhizovicinus]APG03284.1 hypothetical protein BJI69_04740 [Luteibacter rhizovicinus DSM 16549]KLD67718.1 hypothetical protein Y883_06010 [Luteibacter rhizovicinus DSM 16549]KLD76529.1 hypothetical protein Y886_20915 [Xanthomonas hyacinthi DSM 19077]
MTTLARFQDDFAEALHDDAGSFSLAGQAAFAIYRNTAMRACLDALEANYPAVVCLVGRDWFRAAAAIHVAQSPPRDARLFVYGDDFAEFIEAFPPAAGLPYLADVARLDRLALESLVAADVGFLRTEGLTGLDPDALGARRLQLHPATRLFAAATPAVTIWQASRAGVAVSDDLVWQAECAVVTRADLEVVVTPVSASTLRLLEAIGAGASLADAALSTLTVHPDAPIDLNLASLLQVGAFAP